MVGHHGPAQRRHVERAVTGWRMIATMDEHADKARRRASAIRDRIKGPDPELAQQAARWAGELDAAAAAIEAGDYEHAMSTLQDVNSEITFAAPSWGES
jgi:hypothetical protein